MEIKSKFDHCCENVAMGLYFINDPDDYYWIEILPEK